MYLFLSEAQSMSPPLGAHYIFIGMIPLSVGAQLKTVPEARIESLFFLLKIIKLSQHFFFLSFCFLLKSYPFPGSVLGPFMENRWLTICKWVYFLTLYSVSLICMSSFTSTLTSFIESLKIKYCVYQLFFFKLFLAIVDSLIFHELSRISLSISNKYPAVILTGTILNL